MNDDPTVILKILDDCCKYFRFPALDNGYVYLAASRLSLFRSRTDWGLVIEIFGYSPRSGIPDLQVSTFASALHERNPPENYVTIEAYQNYLSNNPHNESRFFNPINDGPWMDEDSTEMVASSGNFLLRTFSQPLPTRLEYEAAGIQIQKDRPSIFEFCRFLAATQRDQILGTIGERRVSILPSMKEILLLDEWHHPDVVSDELPSQSETFQQLAQVLVSGDKSHYRPTNENNTHWSNWPEGGTL